jgi:uncharacterized protein
MLYNVAQLLKAPVGSDLRQPIEGEINLHDPDAALVAPVTGTVRLQRTNQGILATGTAETTVRLQCVRGLESFEQPLRVEFSEMFLPTVEVLSGHPMPPITEDEGFPIDARHHMDLTEMLRQQIILNLPDQPLCRADCAGICPVCGNNRNMAPCDCETQADQRWAALTHLALDDVPSEN